MRSRRSPPGWRRSRTEDGMAGSAATRRDFLRGVASGAAAALLPLPALAQSASGRVVVIGGGFAGATCARTLKRLAPNLAVTLVEANPSFVACPFSNGVIAGLREMEAQRFGYDALVRDGVALSLVPAAAVDPPSHAVSLANGTTLPYDRLVLAPGIDIN